MKATSRKRRVRRLTTARKGQTRSAGQSTALNPKPHTTAERAWLDDSKRTANDYVEYLSHRQDLHARTAEETAINAADALQDATVCRSVDARWTLLLVSGEIWQRNPEVLHLRIALNRLDIRNYLRDDIIALVSAWRPTTSGPGEIWDRDPEMHLRNALDRLAAVHHYSRPQIVALVSAWLPTTSGPCAGISTKADAAAIRAAHEALLREGKCATSTDAVFALADARAVSTRSINGALALARRSKS